MEFPRVSEFVAHTTVVVDSGELDAWVEALNRSSWVVVKVRENK